MLWLCLFLIGLWGLLSAVIHSERAQDWWMCPTPLAPVPPANSGEDKDWFIWYRDRSSPVVPPGMAGAAIKPGDPDATLLVSMLREAEDAGARVHVCGAGTGAVLAAEAVALAVAQGLKPASLSLLDPMWSMSASIREAAGPFARFLPGRPGQGRYVLRDAVARCFDVPVRCHVGFNQSGEGDVVSMLRNVTVHESSSPGEWSEDKAKIARGE